MDFTLWFDESEKTGKKFSCFYGGILVSSDKRDIIEHALNAKKHELHLFNEIKWTKITAQYCDKYIEYLNFFWSYVISGDIKIRIMFKENCKDTRTLTEKQEKNTFFILYYNFVKHAFGFMSYQFEDEINLKILFDKLPNKKEKNEEFKNFILMLNKFLCYHNISISKENIAEVDSRKHVFLQSMDIILGAMDFRLNEKHKEKPEGKNRRGKKTIAKERIYKHIYRLIREMYGYPFNIGVSTGYKITGTKEDQWLMPYRHWSFLSEETKF